jgi:hypothetical protein
MSKFNEILLAYLALISGLAISGVAVYYSVVGLTAIFAAAAIPIIIMGVALEIGKLVATVWLKQNWHLAPRSIKIYLMTAILLLMVITSMGIFGFLSKAHSDQNLVSSEVLTQLAIYEEKIKTTKESIESRRREIKQMDEAVDQIMARSQDEKGAEKSVALRKSQQRDRTRISQEIEAEQKRLSELNNEAAPIQAQVRKVEAEVGPLKYIAAFVYGETDQTVLEKSVTWVIIILIVVFDPLAIVLLLASQISFQNLRNQVATKIEEVNEPLVSSSIAEDTKEETKIVVNTKTETISNLESVDPWSASSTEPVDIKKVKISVKEHRGGGILVDYYCNMIKSSQMTIEQVPEQLQKDVKSRLNEK